MIKFLEDFEYRGYPCLVLEILHMDLHDLVDRSNSRIQLSKIRTIAKQASVIVDGTHFLLCGRNRLLFHFFLFAVKEI